MWEEIGTLVAVFMAVVTVIGWVIIGVIWKTGMDSWRKSIDDWKKSQEDQCKQYPPNVMAFQLNTLWKLYVDQPLENRPDLATHRSPYKLTKDAEDLIPAELKTQLTNLCAVHQEHEVVATGWLVYENVGEERLQKFAAGAKLSIQEALAVLSTYLECQCNHC
jgi:hypothetical protein